MLKTAVIEIVRFCTRFSKSVILAALILAGLSCWYTSENFAINTDISKLISTDLDWRQREMAYDKAFPGTFDGMVAVVEAPTADECEAVCGRLVALVQGAAA